MTTEMMEKNLHKEGVRDFVQSDYRYFVEWGEI